MKILQVPANAGYGGMPLQVLTLARGLAGRGHEVGILTMSDGPMVEKYRESGIEVDVVPFLGRKMRRDPLVAIKTIRFIRAAIARSQPDVIHSHGPRAGLFTGLAIRGRTQPLMVDTVHGSFSQFSMGNESAFNGPKRWIRDRQYRYIDRLTGRYAAGVIAVCEATRKDLVEELGLPPDKVVMIRNGIEESPYDAGASAAIRAHLAGNSGEKLVVFVGRVAFHKGVGFLADAAEAVIANEPGARFVIIGEGPMEEGLRQRAASGPLAGRFEVLGRRTDTTDYIAAADLLVLPSLSEGLPLTLLEASMLGTAMVASDVGGIPEIVIDGETGLLVLPRDSGALGDAILRLLGNDSLRQIMGDNARSLWEREFTAAGMVRETERLYERLQRLCNCPIYGGLLHKGKNKKGQ